MQLQCIIHAEKLQHSVPCNEAQKCIMTTLTSNNQWISLSAENALYNNSKSMHVKLCFMEN